LQPVGVLAAITNDDGTMTRGAELERLAADHHLGLLDVADIVAYRRRREMLVRREASTRLSTRHGEFTAVGYRSSLDHTEHLTLVMGDITATADPVLVRVHSECPIGDVFGSTRCDCGEHLAQAMARIGAAGRGIVVYLRGHPGHKIGLTTNDYDLQERGTITLDANLAQGPPVDSRDYTDAAHILRELKVTSARLLTNNPDKQRQIAAAGIPIACREPLLTTPAAATTAHIWPNGPACALTTRAPQRCSDTPATRESSPP
jgi:3,4-dihydroxy 2-butanone 4-phosphate synthase/GTP cyclohydrolase II